MAAPAVELRLAPGAVVAIEVRERQIDLGLSDTCRDA
jgi:hypothetical protein